MIKFIRRMMGAALVMACAALMPLETARAAPPSATCHGKFPNPITDICWSCIFPISIGAVPIYTGAQEDIENPPNPICICPAPPPKYVRIGLSVGFWEPTRLVDVTRTPFCMVGLGGVSFDPGLDPQRGAQFAHDFQGLHSSYQVHWYLNPILYWLETMTDANCYEKGSFDLVYMTEVDPLWMDDEWSAILHPEALLFANPLAQAVCAADCVAASLNFGIRELFWCGGCQGSVFPFIGHVGTHIGAVQASVLLTHRMAAKMHRQGIAWTYAGAKALCGPLPEPIMDKRQYKTDMVYPIPNTTKIDGKCCQPFGRTTVLWGAGKEFPVLGEDFAYQLFRKRNCCAFSY